MGSGGGDEPRSLPLPEHLHLRAGEPLDDDESDRAGPDARSLDGDQYHYRRDPIDSEAKRTEMETRRKLYAAVTGDEDFATVLGINDTVPALDGHWISCSAATNRPTRTCTPGSPS
ncbi:MAG: hypothetical protein R2705_13055 [Ilumatobacteraceae bacterium]